MSLQAAHTWVALVHYPVYDRNHKVVATALTNLDLHDIARSVRTYNLAGYLIVHPVAAQRELASRIAGHWTGDRGAPGAPKNDFRRMAVERVQVVASLADAAAFVAEAEGSQPTLISTAARPSPDARGYDDIRNSLSGPALLVLGTGWGLTEDALAACAYRLAPVEALRTTPTTADDPGYNHLSVRSACAIILDRLYGDRK